MLRLEKMVSGNISRVSADCSAKIADIDARAEARLEPITAAVRTIGDSVNKVALVADGAHKSALAASTKVEKALSSAVTQATATKTKVEEVLTWAELVYTVSLCIVLMKKFVEYFRQSENSVKTKDSLKKESGVLTPVQVVGKGIDIITLLLIVPCMISMGLGGGLRLAKKIHEIGSTVITCMKGFLYMFGDLFTSVKVDSAPAFVAAEKMIDHSLQSAVTEMEKAAEADESDISRVAGIGADNTDHKYSGIAHAMTVCLLCHCTYDDKLPHICAPVMVDVDIDSKDVSPVAKPELPNPTATAALVAAVGMPSDGDHRPAATVARLTAKASDSTKRGWAKLQELCGQPVRDDSDKRGIGCEKSAAQTIKDSFATLQIRWMSMTLTKRLITCSFLIASLTIALYIYLRSPKSGFKGEKKHGHSGGSAKNKGDKKGIKNDADDSNQHDPAISYLGGGAKTKNECFHSIECPKHAATSETDCDKACGEDCLHWGSCKRVGGPVGTDPTKTPAENKANGKVPAKPEGLTGTTPEKEVKTGCYHATDCPMRKQKPAQQDSKACGVTCGGLHCTHWAECKGETKFVEVTLPVQAAKAAPEFQAVKSKKLKKAEKLVKKAKAAAKAVATPTQSKEKAIDYSKPSPLGQAYLDKPAKFSHLNDVACKNGDKCNNHKFNACPFLHVAKASPAQKAKVKFPEKQSVLVKMTAQSGIIQNTANYDARAAKQYMESVQLEMLFGKSQFIVPKFIGKIEVVHGSSAAFVNCTFVQRANGAPGCVFVEHVLFPPAQGDICKDDSKRAQTFTVIFNNGAREEFKTGEAIKVEHDLMMLKLAPKYGALQPLAKCRKPSDQPEEVYMPAFNGPSMPETVISNGRLFDKYHNCATLPGNCSAPLVSPANNVVLGFHQGAIPDEKVNVCIPVSSALLGALSN
jgi:hypothetical protein